MGPADQSAEWSEYPTLRNDAPKLFNCSFLTRKLQNDREKLHGRGSVWKLRVFNCVPEQPE